jgi:hypothetical protein
MGAEFDQFHDYIMDLLASAQRRAWEQAWCNAPRTERRFRMKLIRELSVALASVEAESIQSTVFGERVIEAIILGDYAEATANADILRTAQRPERWACFLAMLDAALAIKRGEQPA